MKYSKSIRSSQWTLEQYSNLLHLATKYLVACLTHIYGPPEGLDNPKYRARYQDMFDTEIMVRDDMIYMESQGLVED
jgi:hypothetical protein